MGCDIHGYIEFKHPKNDRWEPFGKRLRLDRTYLLFGLLANVRCDGALIEPRGMPSDIGYDVRDDYLLRVTDKFPEGDGSVGSEKAARWVADGSSAWWGDDYITGPDWHTPSWLSTSEYYAVVRAYNDAVCEEGRPHGIGVEYPAALGAMVAAEEVGHKARFVFFFDN